MDLNAVILADVYRSLAEVFAYTSGEQIPAWFSLAGKDWPLLPMLVTLSEQRPSTRFEKAIELIKKIEGRSIRNPQQEYQTLFFGNGNLPIWLYESHYKDGRVPGPTTFAVKNLYSTTGLRVTGAELPDHLSVELAFLAHLVEQEIQHQSHAEVWRSARQLFLKNHFMCWFPNVVRGITRSEYPAWVAIGYVSEALFFGKKDIPKKTSTYRKIPMISSVDECTLCGFCTQKCPERALNIIENNDFTTLWLSSDSCKGCGMCISTCPEGVMTLKGEISDDIKVILRISPRSICPRCGTPTISEAELAYISSRIGVPEWLVYCVECRKYNSYLE